MTIGIVTACSTTKSIYKNEVRDRFKSPIKKSSSISIADLAKLPAPVAKYLEYAGWVGKEKPLNFYCKFAGDFTMKVGAKSMKFKIEQYSWLDKPMRLFQMKNWMIGGRHKMDERGAFMLIKVLDRFKVVDAAGPIMNQSELVTYLNDMFILAPGALIDAPITWETIDELTVKATISEYGNTISATIYFNEKGELVNFVSYDRYYSTDGIETINYPWWTPMSDYVEENGIKHPAYGEAVWELPDRKFSYAKFHLKELKYNLTEIQK